MEEGGGTAVRLLTLNVHCWEDAEGKDNVAGVIDVIRECNADVVVLQEVTRCEEILGRVASAVKMEYFAVGPLSYLLHHLHPPTTPYTHRKEEAGSIFAGLRQADALLSRFPIKT